MSIRGRLLLLVLIAAVPVFLLDVWSEVAERQQLRARLRGEALQLAGHAAAEQDLRFENARYLLATLAESDLISGEDSDNCSAFLEGLADKFPIYVDIGAAYPNGTIICSSEPTSRGSNVADREYFQRVLRTTAFTVGVVQRGTVSDRKIIGMAYPVTVANGEIRAVFLLSLDLPRVSRDLAVPQAPGGNVTITVFDANGAVLARQPGGEEWIGRKPPAGSFVEVIQRESRGAVEAEGLDGVERIIGFAPLIEARGLHVAVGIPTAALFADAEAAFRRKMMLLAAVFVAAAVLAYLGGQATIRRPLAKLTKAVERLGTGDLQARSQIDSSVPEFALLGWRFDGMADHLERREKDLRQANEDLQRVNAELRQALAEKEVLFREVHHRVRNNLQVVSSLLHLQASRFNDAAINEAFRSSLNRVTAMGIVHQLLYESDELAQLDFGALLRNLCTNLRPTFKNPPERVTIRVDAEPIRLNLDTAIPLALIANELVSNALQHAFPDDRPGEVAVTLACRDKRPVLSVIDNGIGLSEEVRGAEQGLGLVMIKNLVRQVDGTLRMDFESGLLAEIVLPEGPR